MRNPSRGLCLLLASVVAFLGCDGDAPADAGPPDGLEARKREILASLGERVILPTLRDFADAAAALEVATAENAADPTDVNRAAAQAAWRGAMLVWERAELMQIGPAGMGGIECPVVGGQDKRDEIYSWDLTSECRIDQETVAQMYPNVDAFAAELVNVRGLDAMEYLLFVATPTNACNDLSPINADGTWAALGDTEVAARRAAFAHALAQLVSREAVALRDAWEPSIGGFETQLATAGLAGSAYPSAQSAINDIGGALLYVDNGTRDMKLGEPAGISGCLTATCFESLELPHARIGVLAILENLHGFDRMFRGEGPGVGALGLDDLLVDVGAGAVAAMLGEAIDAAVVALEALGSDSVEDAVTADPAAVLAAYEALGVVQRIFKTDVVSALDIDPTSCVPGDND
jgi:predicted lipoprotein